MSFIYGSLLSEDDQTLERLHLNLMKKYSASDINFWVQVAVNRSVRKLRFNLFGKTLVLPSCTCTTLKSLILRDLSIDLVPRGFSLPPLKSLHLFSVRFSQSIVTFLRRCPVLEYLVLHQTWYGDWNIGEVALRWVCLSSLKSLHLLSAKSYNPDSLTSLLQSCPVLEYLVVHESQRDLIPMFDVIPPAPCLSSIKSLRLSSVRFSGDESIETLLKRFVALEDLVISRTRDDNVRLYNINVPTLKSLTINNSIERCIYDDNHGLFSISVPTLKSLTISNTREEHVEDKENHGFWITAPALETLNIKDTVSNFLMLEFMPEVTKANSEVICDKSQKFIGSLILVQHLSLCSRTPETPYRSGSIFPYLEHLELCTCSAGWANLLSSILNDAPRLQSLTLKSNHSAPSSDPMHFWNEPAVVPECLLMHLEIFEWRQYEDTAQQRKVAAYILASSTCLKMATFSTRSGDKDHCIPMQINKLHRISKTHVS